MRYEEYADYASEIGQLERMLEEFSDDTSDDTLIERIGLEQRLKKARGNLNGVPIPRRPRKVRVLFYGDPISGTSGIDANFGPQAVRMVSDTIRLATAGFTGILRETGQVPRSELGQPTITGVATGSFGFELELPTSLDAGQWLTFDGNPAEEALKKVKELLAMSAKGTGEEIAEIADEIHPRAVKKAAELLDFMRRRKAQFAVNFEGEEVRFETAREIEDSAKHLGDKNIQETSESILGTIIGVIPARRRFQLDRFSDGTPIEGRIGRELRNPLTTVQPYTNRLVLAQIRSIRVGRGRPKYSLTSISEAPALVDH